MADTIVVPTSHGARRVKHEAIEEGQQLTRTRLGNVVASLSRLAHLAADGSAKQGNRMVDVWGESAQRRHPIVERLVPDRIPPSKVAQARVKGAAALAVACRFFLLGERVRNLFTQGFPSGALRVGGIKPRALSLLDVGHELLSCAPARLVTAAADNVTLFRGESIEAVNRSIRAQPSSHARQVEPLAVGPIGGAAGTESMLLYWLTTIRGSTRATLLAGLGVHEPTADP